MKNKFKLSGIAVVITAIVFALLFTGCSENLKNDNDSNGGGGSGTTFTNIDTFNTWLSKQPNNSPDNPYRVKLNISNNNDLQRQGIGSYSCGGKYVYLDLSGSTITGIREDAFYPSYGGAGDSLVGIILPNSVTSIGEKAFYQCRGLTSITIPDSVKSIGNDAFRGCTSLTSVTIGNGVTSIGEGAFSWCDDLTSVTIGNSVTSIGKEAFSMCSDLTSVTIPNSVKSIGEGAFSWCDDLTSVTIGNGVTSMGNSAFEHCTSLTSVTFQGTISESGFSLEINPFPGDLTDKYLATDGGIGTYTRPSTESNEWTKQP